MAKHLKIDNASAQVKDFLHQLDVESAKRLVEGALGRPGEYIIEVAGKPLVGVVPPWQVEKLSQREKRSSLFLTKAGNGIVSIGRSRRLTKL